MSKRKTPISADPNGWRLNVNQTSHQEEEEEEEEDDLNVWRAGLCCLGMLGLLAGAAALIWLALLDIPSGSSGIAGPAGPAGPAGAVGPVGPAGVVGTAGSQCWDLNANTVCDLGTEDINLDGNCDATDCSVTVDDEWLFLTGPGVGSPPCDCNLAAGPTRCDVVKPGKLVTWHRQTDKMKFFCNLDTPTGQWWSEAEYDFHDDQLDECPAGNAFPATPGCGLVVGSDEATLTDRHGFFIKRDIVITGFVYTDAGDAFATCNGLLVESFNLDIYHTTVDAHTGFLSYAPLLVGGSNSPLVNLAVNVPIKGGRWITVGMENGCTFGNGVIDNWGVKLIYREAA